MDLRSEKSASVRSEKNLKIKKVILTDAEKSFVGDNEKVKVAKEHEEAPRGKRKRRANKTKNVFGTVLVINLIAQVASEDEAPKEHEAGISFVKTFFVVVILSMNIVTFGIFPKREDFEEELVNMSCKMFGRFRTS